MPASSALNDAARQRRFSRQSLFVSVEFKNLQGDVIHGTTLNLSKGGMFIQTPTPLSDGIKTFFKLQVSTSQTGYHLEGEVVWSHRKRGPKALPPYGMGIRFLPSRVQSEKTLEGIFSVLNK